MGLFSRFEDKMEDTVDAAASRMSKAPISPVQIAKKAERQMRRETMVGAGKEYAPTLYTVLVNPEDDARLFGYYPTLAGETETYLRAKAVQEGLIMDGNPLVRFIVDDKLRRGKFDVIAETVSAPIIAQLRDEEMERYGLLDPSKRAASQAHQQRQSVHAANPAPAFDDDYDAPVGGPASMHAGHAQPANRRGHGNNHIPQNDYSDAVYDDYADAPQVAGAQATLIDLSTNRPYDLVGLTTIGRDKSCSISINDIAASRRHAEIRQDSAGLWILDDLNSTNGTMVNGNQISSQPLYLGDIITIGKTDFEFTAGV